MNKTTIMEKMDGILAETNKLKALLDDKCEFCTHDTACRMHYNAQLRVNVGSVEYNKPAKGNF